MSNKEIQQVARLLRYVRKEGLAAFDLPANAKFLGLRDRLAERFSPATDAQLDALSRSPTADMSDFIYGPPVSKGDPTLLPVIRVKWAVQDSGDVTLAMRVALFGRDSAASSGFSHSWGWRFETPNSLDPTLTPAASSTASSTTSSGGDTAVNKGAAGQVASGITDRTGDDLPAGRHDYYHAQPLTSWSKGEGPLPKVVKANTSQPAFKLDAHNAPTLVAASIVSLYGLEDWVRGIRNLPGIGEHGVLDVLRPVRARTDRSVDPVAKKGKSRTR